MSMHLNYALMALLEAQGDAKNKKAANAAEDDAADENTPAEDPGAEETPAEENPEEGTQEEETNPDEGGEEENADENQDENQNDEGEEEQPTEEEQPAEDDFSLDPEGGEEEDSGPNPDGLPDPDDDGSGDSPEETEGEVNVHTNILQLSKIDRILAKKKCFSDYQELRTSITSVRNLIDSNEATIDPAIRNLVIEKLNKLDTAVMDYMTYKFGYINYEENLQNYMLFMKSLNDLILMVKNPTDKKSSRKLTVDSSETSKKSKESKSKSKKKEKTEEQPEEEEPEEPESDENDEGTGEN